MVGTVYTFINEPQGSPTRDAREFSPLLNACGRTGNPSIGISMGLGDRNTALTEANEVVANLQEDPGHLHGVANKIPRCNPEIQDNLGDTRREPNTREHDWGLLIDDILGR